LVTVEKVATYFENLGKSSNFKVVGEKIVENVALPLVCYRV